VLEHPKKNPRATIIAHRVCDIIFIKRDLWVAVTKNHSE
jgi:hypothetical protein